MDWTIRAATAADAPIIAELARRLSWEDGQTRCALRPEDVLEQGFGASPRFRAVLAERAGQPLGYALFYPSYDTDHAARGFYLQDLYVVPEARREGLGRALMAAVGRACLAAGGCYLFWNARPDNADGLAFYRAIGAHQERVLTLSLQPDALRRLAADGG
jgi:ribosomal protein S18 acetylase RimI-like enzyme